MPAKLHLATHSGYYRFERSDDGWVQVERALPFWSLTCIAVDPDDSESIYLGTERSGIFSSHDGGLSWSRPDPNVPRLMVTSLLPSTTGLLVGTVPAALYRSRSGGWDEIESLRHSTADSSFPPNPDLGARTRCLARDPRMRGLVYAGIEVGGILVSEDGGHTWEPANDGLSDPDVHEVCPSFHTPGLVFAACGEEGLFRSFDRGAHWGLVTPEGARAYGTAVAEDSAGHIYLGLTRGRPNTWVRPERADGAIYSSERSGEKWELLAEGLPGAVMDFCPRPDGVGVIAGTSEGELLEVTSGGSRALASALPCITALTATT